MTSSQYLGNKSTNPFSFGCAPNQYITAVSGRSGAITDGLQFSCSDGTTSPWYGAQSGGGLWTKQMDSGWAGLKATSDVDLNTLILVDQQGNLSDRYGYQVGWQNLDFTCPTGQNINKVDGYAGGYVSGMQVHCGKPSAPVPVINTAVPTSNTAGVLTVVSPTSTTSSSGSSAASSYNWTYIMLFILFVVLVVVSAYMYNSSTVPKRPNY